MKLYSRIWGFFCIAMINEKLTLLQILQEDLCNEIDFNDNYQYKKITFFSQSIILKALYKHICM